MVPKTVSQSRETFNMRKKHFKKIDINANLQFPPHIQGEWQYMTIKKNSLIYRDPNSFKTYSMSLIEKIEPNRFVVFSKSQCGEESYKCIAITELAENVIETQIGSESMKILQNYDICGNENFDSKEWITQGSEFD
jgi:predicted nucleic-acid-binding Zn-ribbon protein